MASSFTPGDFRKSSFSNPDANCVEVARGADVVELRDSKTAFGSSADARLHVPPSAFAAFVSVLAGEHA